MNTEKRDHPGKRKKKRTWLKVLGVVILLLLIVRLILPFVIVKVVNKKLSVLSEYFGHIEDVDLALIRGAYKIKGVELRKIEKNNPVQDTTPFFKCPEIDLSVEWKSLFKGKIVGEIEVESPRVNFVQGKHKDENVKRDTSDFRDVIKTLMPLTINHFEIRNGEVHYLDKNSSPFVDVHLDNLQVTADNLTNVNDSAKVLPAGMHMRADSYGGHIEMGVKFNALEKQPTFDLNARVENVDMVKLNDFFKAYGKFDVEKGKFGLYTEFAGRDGAFRGYVKPLLKDVQILKLDKEEGNAFQIMYEAVIGGVKSLFENHKKEQVATKLPVEGRFDQPETGLWTAINYVLRNAFVLALRPTIDNSIDIGNVQQQEEDKSFLGKIFGKKDKKDKK